MSKRTTPRYREPPLEYQVPFDIQKRSIVTTHEARKPMPAIGSSRTSMLSNPLMVTPPVARIRFPRMRKARCLSMTNTKESPASRHKLRTFDKSGLTVVDAPPPLPRVNGATSRTGLADAGYGPLCYPFRASGCSAEWWPAGRERLLFRQRSTGQPGRVYAFASVSIVPGSTNVVDGLQRIPQCRYTRIGRVLGKTSKSGVVLFGRPASVWPSPISLRNAASSIRNVRTA